MKKNTSRLKKSMIELIESAAQTENFIELDNNHTYNTRIYYRTPEDDGRFIETLLLLANQLIQSKERISYDKNHRN